MFCSTKQPLTQRYLIKAVTEKGGNRKFSYLRARNKFLLNKSNQIYLNGLDLLDSQEKTDEKEIKTSERQ